MHSVIIPERGLFAPEPPKPPDSLGDGKLLSGGAKIFMDGSGGARTAWFYKDSNKNSTGADTGNKGYPATEPEVYRAQVMIFHEAGVHIGTHAIGDRAPVGAIWMCARDH